MRVASAAVLLAILALASADAATLAQTVIVLAENILGAGTVRSVRTVDRDTQVLIRWESPTYQARDEVAVARLRIHGEALLVTSAVLTQLPQVARIRFTILNGNQILATGQSERGRQLSIVFSSTLGKGSIVTGPGDVEPYHRPPGGEIQEL